MTFDTALAGSGIVAVSITRRRREADVRGVPDKTLEEAQKALDDANPHVAGFALPGVTVHGPRGGRAREADRPQRRRLPAGDDAGRRRWRSRGSRSARTTIISATAKRATRWPARTTPARSISARTTTRRDRRRCSRVAATLAQAAAPPQRARRLLVGRRARADRLERVRRDAAGAARSARRLPELRHGRPDAGQQADRAGDRHEPGVGQDHRAGERRGRLRPRGAGRIRISRPTSRPSTSRASRA